MSTDDARGVERELLAEALHERLCTDDFTRGEPSCGICEDDADALLASPQFARLIEQREAAARAEAEAVHRDLVSRLGFGDNITEPMADNDTIVRWFEERGSEANEWAESQLWRNDCYAAGHPDDEDCWEHDPLLVARAEGRREVREAVEGLHFRRPWQSMLDTVTFGQAVFPDQCNHCRVAWPCATSAVLAGQGGESGEGA